MALKKKKMIKKLTEWAIEELNTLPEHYSACVSDGLFTVDCDVSRGVARLHIEVRGMGKHTYYHLDTEGVPSFRSADTKLKKIKHIYEYWLEATKYGI